MSPFPALEDKTVINGRKVRTRTAFPGLTPPQPRAFDEADARKMLETSRELGVAPNDLEPLYPALSADLEYFKSQSDRALGLTEQLTRLNMSFPEAGFHDPDISVEPGPVGAREMARRFIYWPARIPFSPAGAMQSGSLIIAAHRLKTDSYGTEKRKLARIGMELSAGIEGVEPPVGTTIETVAEQISSGALRQADIAQLERFLLKRQEVAERGMTWGAKVFDGVSYLPAWMIEFALTGGLAKLGSETAKDIGLKTLQGYAKTSGGRAVLKAAGWTGAQIARSTLGMPHRLADEILERRVNQITLEDGKIVQVDPESWATSIWKGWAANLIEVASESAGEGIVKGGAWIGRNTLAKMPLGSRLYEGLRRAYVATHPVGGAADEFAARFFDAAQFDGLLGEMGEERLATILHAIVGTEDFGLGPDAGPLERLKQGLAEDIKNLPVEVAVLAVPGGAKMALDARGRARDAKTPPTTEEVPRVPTEGATVGPAETPTVEEAAPGQVTAQEKSPIAKGDVRIASDEGRIGVADATSPETMGSVTDPMVQSDMDRIRSQEEYEKELAEFHRRTQERSNNLSERVKLPLKARISTAGRPTVALLKAINTWLKPHGYYAKLNEAVGRASAYIQITPEERRKADDASHWGVWDFEIRISDHPSGLGYAERPQRGADVEIDRRNQSPHRVYQDVVLALDSWAEENEVPTFSGLAVPPTETIEPVTPERQRATLAERAAFKAEQEKTDAAAKAEATLTDMQAQKLGEYLATDYPTKKLFQRAMADLGYPPQGHRYSDYARVKHAWEKTPRDLKKAAYEYTPPKRPEGAVNQAFGIDTTEPTEWEIRDQVREQAADEASEAVREYFGEPDPVDLPVQDPPIEDIGLLKRIWQRFAGPDVEILSDKDFRDIWKFIQMPGDIARSFKQFRPVYEIQRAREVAKQTLDRYFGEKLGPYFDLSRREQLEVDRVLVMMEQNLTGIQSHLDALSKPQYAAYTAVREALDEAAEMLVKYMEKMGVREEWIEQFRGRIGFYIPHKWYGKYRVIAKEGKRTIDMTGVDSKKDVQEHLDRMRSAHPEAKVFAIEATKMPMDAYQDVSYQGIVEMIDRVVEETNKKMGARKELTEDQKTVINQAWADMWKEKGFGMHFIQRAETPGWTEDLRKPILEYFSGFAGYLTKMEACQQFPDGLAEIDASRTPQLYKYASEYVRYLTGQESGAVSAVSRATKKLMFFCYLYGNIKSATVNLTQNHVLGWPVLSKLTKWPLAKMLVHQARTAAGQLTAEEKSFLSRLEERGELDPKFATELRDSGGNPVYRAAWKKGAKVYDFFDFFSKAEQFNRRAMAVALYHADPSLRTDLKRTAEFIEEAHFRYSKGNRPTLWRGAASPFMTFRSYAVNYLTWLKNEVKEGRIGPAAKSMAALTFYGGLLGTPVGMAIGAIWRWIFQSDPEGDMREALGDLAEAITLDRETGEKVSDLLMRGAPSALGVSLTGSLAINGIIPRFGADVDPEEAVREWMLGVIGGIPQRANRVSASMRAGDTLRALEDASPEFLRNPLAAIRMYRQGAATRSGRPIIDHEFHRQMKLTEYDAIIKSLGFQPDRLDKQYQIKMYLDEIYARKQALKAQWADRFILAAKTRDKEGMDEIIDEMDHYNRKMESRNRPDLKIATKEMDAMLNTRTKPVGLPSESMLDTYARIWKQYYGTPKEQP